MALLPVVDALYPFAVNVLPILGVTYSGMFDQSDLHAVFIALHAIGGVLSFLSGSLFLSKSNARDHGRLFGLYLWSLVGMVGFLVAAMTVWWTQYSDFEQMVFPGLLALGLYMLYRGFSARSSVLTDDLSPGYIHDIGFTLIALFEGFIIVFLINMNAPAGVVVVVAILGVILGREGITRLKHTNAKRELVA